MAQSQNSLSEAFAELADEFSRTSSLVRVVLSGRRRNMQTPAERIDIRPVKIKDELVIPLTTNMDLDPNASDEDDSVIAKDC